MWTSHDQPGPGRTDSSWPVAMMLDGLQDDYIDWRASATAVADAYARWSSASGLERAVRFAAYTATLDQEEMTAAAYAKALTDLALWLQRSPCHRGS